MSYSLYELNVILISDNGHHIVCLFVYISGGTSDNNSCPTPSEVRTPQTKLPFSKSSQAFFTDHN